MNVEVQFAVPFAVGMPDSIARQLLDVFTAMGIGAANGPQGAGNLLVLVAQPVDINLPDNVIQELQDVIGAAIGGKAILGPPNPIPAPTPTPTPQPVPPVSGGSPGDLSTAIANAAAQFGVPEILLERIWRIEAGGAFPNPCLNDGTHIGGCFTAAQAPHGYGGLFGLNQDTARANGFSLDDPNTTQQQADVTARGLRGWHDRLGSWVAAANAWNVGPNGTGGYGPSVAAGLD